MTTEIYNRVELDLSGVRTQFPSLSMQAGGRTAVFLDNPGGTQVSQTVIEAVSEYYRTANANTGGAFLTSQRNDQTVFAARQAMADLLNAADPSEIAFGANMTTLTFNFARAFGRTLQSGDEIIVTTLDHDANVAPWLAYEELGAVIRVVDIVTPDCTLDMNSLQNALSGKTRLVAVTAASNATGTFPDVAKIVQMAHAAGAKVFVDAVQAVPHIPVDVQALDCDFLACSAYKFFGPHVGILYGKHALLEELRPYKVRPAYDFSPHKWETGTQNFEGMAGTTAAVNYLAQIGRDYGQAWHTEYAGNFSGRRLDLKTGMAAIKAYEQQLSRQLIEGLQQLNGVQIYGITDMARLDERGPTICFTWGIPPRETAEYLGQHGIFCWNGNYYALSLMERLDLQANGGAIRIGLAHYNTPAEVDYLLQTLKNREHR
jgi:cysteine desulfurase family protein (TIGR01976 family)